MAMGQHYHPPPCHRHHPHNHRWHCCRHHRQHMIIDQHQHCSRERCHFGQDLEFIDQSFLPVFSVLAMLTFFSTWLSGKLYQYCRNNQFWASSYPPTQLDPNRPTLWKIFIAASRDLIEATCLLRKYFPQPSFKSTLSTVPYFTLKRPHMDRAAIILTLLDPEGGGRSAPSRANVITHKNQWVEILIIFCIFLSSCICIFLMHVADTTFLVKKTFCFVGGSSSWSETPYFHKRDPYEWCQSCLWAPKWMRKKTFFYN